MNWSLGEIEILGRKAARGAGRDWGLAEEAGKALRWLCAAGWPGAGALAALLVAQRGRDWRDLCPRIETACWGAPGGVLCPLGAGAALCDRAEQLAAGKAVRLGSVAHPLLLVPYMVWAADMTGARLRIAWPGIRITHAEGETHAAIDSPAALAAALAGNVDVGTTGAAQGVPVKRGWRGEVSAQSAQVLTGLARRTYAPATPESRLSGAGAGLLDND